MKSRWHMKSGWRTKAAEVVGMTILCWGNMYTFKEAYLCIVFKGILVIFLMLHNKNVHEKNAWKWDWITSFRSIIVTSSGFNVTFLMFFQLFFLVALVVHHMLKLNIVMNNNNKKTRYSCSASKCQHFNCVYAAMLTMLTLALSSAVFTYAALERLSVLFI